jgi:ubiquinone/menaquinone biosynthesis C-methylase UbiE
VEPGDTVVDVGCGPGFFTIPLAAMVGSRGHVVAVDLQQGMLDLARSYAEQERVEDRIQFHLCQQDSLALNGVKADFVFIFYVLHEIPDKEDVFKQLAGLVKRGGKVFVCEPPFHVSKSAFQEYIDMATRAGFEKVPVKKVGLSKTMLLQRL